MTPHRPFRHKPLLLRCISAGCMLAALTGCSTISNRPGTIAGMQASPDGQTGCVAPTPNLRAAYNRPYDVHGRVYRPLPSASGYDVTGLASWYGWESGSTTAMGTAFSPRLLTAASRELPLPTCVWVTNLRNGRSVLVLVDDRGPFVDGRILDLSYASAQALGIRSTSEVRIVALDGTAQPPIPAAQQPEPTPAVPAPSASMAAQTPAVVVVALDASPHEAALAIPAQSIRQDTTAPAPVLQPRNYLQTGAYASLQHARAERNRLLRAGIDAVDISPGLVRGQRWYRVQIGPLAEAAPEPALLQRLQRLGVTHPSVVQQ